MLYADSIIDAGTTQIKFPREMFSIPVFSALFLVLWGSAGLCPGSTMQSVPKCHIDLSDKTFKWVPLSGCLRVCTEHSHYHSHITLLSIVLLLG